MNDNNHMETKEESIIFILQMRNLRFRQTPKITVNKASELGFEPRSD